MGFLSTVELIRVQQYNWNRMEEIHEVIIIGSGISGLAASWQLTKAGVEHIIVESRDRLGGRITEKDLDGIPIPMGASYIHGPNLNNPVAKLMKDWQWETIDSHHEAMQYVVRGKGQMNAAVLDQAMKMMEDMMESFAKVARNAQHDISLDVAAQEFFSGIKDRSQEVQQVLRWWLAELAHIEGAELNQLSAKQFESFEKDDDILPADGYLKVYRKIYDECKPTVELKQKVIKVDYSSKVIKVHTEAGRVFQGKRVISSLPLGILQKKLVEFYPPLPQKYEAIISKMGNGVANKVFATFEHAFWDTKQSWVNFLPHQPNGYTSAFVVPNVERPMLCFFVSGHPSVQMSKRTNQEIKEELQAFLNDFKFTQEVKVREVEATRWHLDPETLGCYSYIAVGTTREDIRTISTPIDGKLWFIGEHTHPINKGCVHGAYGSGISAAEQVIPTLKQ